ncbi:cold shock domain-containing protein c2 [Limosa lapponica baueri]|uniref:Cold shock domain-containing protein c2 n=1 Tax=Limosa lapponica baueri TaxID=1758121 RepID=A0A2I0USH2_LIMLA|nr:cold shock domain-containing protein c2 [Limosa lapponica baueri]
MEKRSPGERCGGPACGNPCLEPSLFPSWFLPFTAAPWGDADSGSLLAITLLVSGIRPARLGAFSPAAHLLIPKTEEPADPTMSSDPSAPPAVPPLHSPKSPVWPTFPFQREGSRIWERGNLLLRDLPSPLPTKRTRTYSATARASAGPIFKGVCKQFSRSQGHGFITPENGTEDIFVHVSDIEGEYVPVEGDEVTYKVCPIPPKNQKFQAVEVVLTNLAPHTKHETWSGQIIGS